MTAGRILLQNRIKMFLAYHLNCLEVPHSRIRSPPSFSSAPWPAILCSLTNVHPPYQLNPWPWLTKLMSYCWSKSRDSSVSVVAMLSAVNRWTVFRFATDLRSSSLLQKVLSSAGAYKHSIDVGAEDFPLGRAAMTWSWPLIMSSVGHIP